MTHSRRRFGLREHLAVNALCVAFQFQDTALFSVIVPMIVLELVPHAHVLALASLATLATAVGTLTPAAAGYLSDRGKRAHVSRRVQTALVVGLDVLALTVIATTRSAVTLTVAAMVAALAVVAGETVYQAILPEVVPRPRWGFSTGVRGALTLVGAAIGLIAASSLPSMTAIFVNAAFLAAGSLTMFGIPPDRDAVTDVTQRPVARGRRDLFVTMILRGFMVLGIGLFTTYGLYFFHDVLRVADAPLRTGLTALVALVAAVISSVGSGVVADRVDRRHVVAAGGMLMGVASLGFAFNPEPNALLYYAALLGIGLGAVYVAGFALTLGAVPDAANFGRELGLWATLSGLPAIVAPALGGFILALFHHAPNGYRALFISAGISFALAALSALFVRRRVAT